MYFYLSIQFIYFCFKKVDEWIDFAKEQLTKENAAERRTVASLFKTLDTHLTLRTYLVGHGLSLADIFVYNSVIRKLLLYFIFRPKQNRELTLQTCFLNS